MPTTWTNPFSADTLAFLAELAANNDRDWFNANKTRYEDLVKDAALRFISDFGPRLRKISPNFTAVPKTARGSLMRIYRDTRFGKDKTPYKTNVGIRFPHARQRDVHAPGFYLHIEPGSHFVGVGAWRPEPDTLRAFRERIAADPAGWKKASRGKRFAEWFELGGESLKRPPKGFDPEHRYIEDLKRKDFIALHSLTDDELLSNGLLDDLADSYRRSVPYMRFLCGAVGADF